jgi:hypothetical protein
MVERNKSLSTCGLSFTSRRNSAAAWLERRSTAVNLSANEGAGVADARRRPATAIASFSEFSAINPMASLRL